MLSFYSFLENTFTFQKSGLPPKKSAGCFFTDGKLYLAGYQPKKKIPCITGIGGNLEDDESDFQCAIRELIEELFEIHPVPYHMRKDIEAILVPQRTVCNNSYTMFQFSFQDLELILKRIQNFQIPSPLYDSFPITISELVFQRRVLKGLTPEITHLVVLPFVDHPLNKELLSPCLRSDVNILKSTTPIE